MKHGILLLKLFVALVIPATMTVAHETGKLSVFDGFWSDSLRYLTWTIESRGTDPASAAPRVFAFPIDGASVREFAKEGISWPFPRSVYAQAVKRLESLGVRAVAFDVFFSQHDKAPGLEEFVQALASSSMKVVLAATLEDAGVSLQQAENVAAEDDDEEGYAFLKSRRMITMPHAHLREKAWGIGLINSELDINLDRVFRRQPPAYFHEGRWYPGLGIALVMAAEGGVGDLQVVDRQLRLPGGRVIPLEPITASQSKIGAEWAAEPRWRDHSSGIDQGCGRYFFTNFHNLVKGINLWAPEKLKGSVAIIGVGNDFLGDTIAIPGNSYAAGLTLHAQMADSLLGRGFMRRLDQGSWKYLPELLLFLLTLWTFWAQSRTTVWKGVFLAIMGYVGLSIACLMMFTLGYTMSCAVWGLGFPLVLSGVYIVGYFSEGREKAKIRELFSKQVAPSVVQVLLRDPERVLTPKRHEISVCFVDVCGFTSFSEKHTADRVLVQLNFYFSHLVQVVHRFGGTLDKFIGDAMMITTGVPLFDANHALNMIKLALEIRRQVGQINTNLPAGLEPFQVSCGINSGEAVLGNVGASERMEFTVIGDTVNVASRLQGKSGPMEIVIGSRTYDLVKDQVVVESLEPVAVKGKSELIQAFRLVKLKE